MMSSILGGVAIGLIGMAILTGAWLFIVPALVILLVLPAIH